MYSFSDRVDGRDGVQRMASLAVSQGKSMCSFTSGGVDREDDGEMELETCE
jgi:hypothetical protein